MYSDISNEEFEKMLYEASKKEHGRISDMLWEASIRIAVLSAKDIEKKESLEDLLAYDPTYYFDIDKIIRFFKKLMKGKGNTEMTKTSNYVEVTPEQCSKCKYSSFHSGYYMCNYILVEQKSRIFENGKRRDIPKGYCDKYTERNGSLWV